MERAYEGVRARVREKGRENERIFRQMERAQERTTKTARERDENGESWGCVYTMLKCYAFCCRTQSRTGSFDVENEQGMEDGTGMET